VTIKLAVLRARAEADIDAIVDGYLAEAGVEVALDFTEALDRALRHVERNPATGSLRYGDRSGAPGLRFWPIRRFPHLVFYVERADRIDILRVLHGHRDIPAALRDESR
jgi:toxin ParE1/3/4